MNLLFPSALQLRYAQSIFPIPLPPSVIVQLLIEVDDVTFYKLRYTSQFLSFCCKRSAFCAQIYQQRVKRRVYPLEVKYGIDIMQFRESQAFDGSQKQMSWREFDKRMKIFIETPYQNVDIYDLITKNKFMELKILYACEGDSGTGYGYYANWSAMKGKFHILKWICEQIDAPPTRSDADHALRHHNIPALEWMVSQGVYPFGSTIEHTIQRNKNKDVIDWLKSKELG